MLNAQITSNKIISARVFEMNILCMCFRLHDNLKSKYELELNKLKDKYELKKRFPNPEFRGVPTFFKNGLVSCMAIILLPF